MSWYPEVTVDADVDGSEPYWIASAWNINTHQSAYIENGERGKKRELVQFVDPDSAFVAAKKLADKLNNRKK